MLILSLAFLVVGANWLVVRILHIQIFPHRTATHICRSAMDVLLIVKNA